MNREKIDNQPEQPDERTVFVPSEEIRCIEQALNKLEQAEWEFRKVAEGMKPGQYEINQL